MIISHKYRFIFLKTRKTAGTSIEVFLSQCCAENDVVTPIYPHVAPHVPRNHRGIWNPLWEFLDNRGHGFKTTLSMLAKRDRFYNHIPARTVRSRVSNKVWRGYFKFCVERNPWDKTISYYHHLRKHASCGDLTFDQYLSSGDFCLNYPVYTDARGHVIVDRVLKYESLMDQLGEVFGDLGVPFQGTLGVNAKSDTRTDRRPYQEILSSEQREIITRAFAKEIEMHGYTF